MNPSEVVVDAENGREGEVEGGGGRGGEINGNPEIETENGLKKQDLSEDHSSPRGVLEIPVLGSDTDSSSVSTSDSTDSRSSSFSSSEKLIKNQIPSIPPEVAHHGGVPWRGFIDVFKKKSVKTFTNTIPMLTSSDIMKLKLNRKLARFRSNEEQIEDFGLSEVDKPSWRNFDLAELEAATNNFSPARMIGKGGHAEVYKGYLSDGKLVAVKRLLKKGIETKEEERTSEFLSELGIIAHINHPNAARLLGYGVEGGQYLVLEFLAHGSLASFIHGTVEDSLKWGIRFKVALGIAEGLNYLHLGCHRRIIHRDIKASNILLTKDYKPQISDFGLAKWLPEKWTHHIVFPIEGTFGYLAPEYFMHGIVDEKTDVFAYGVLLLELLTGRLAVDSSRQSLAMWARPLLEMNNMKELVDPRLGDAYDVDEMELVMLTASMCIHHLSTMRPSMSLVVQLLKGGKGSSSSCSDAEMLMMMMMGGGGGEKGRQQMKPNKPSIMDGCDIDDYTCSTYLHDLTRHRELALLD